MRQNEKQENFEKWFAGSVVRHADGQPKRVYHGTYHDFSVFDGYESVGWFSSDVALSNSRYTDGESDDAGPNVMPVYLSIKRPLPLFGRFDMDDPISSIDRMIELVPELDLDYLDKRRGVYPPEEKVWLVINNIDFMNALIRAGFDGIQIGESGTETWAPVCPKQVKSAVGNCGAFNPADPDITR